MTRILLLPVFLLLTTVVLAQSDSIQNLYFFKKDHPVVFAAKDYQPGRKKAFYIYRNCVYRFTLINKKQISAWVQDVKNDSIYYTEFYGDPGVVDTLAIHPSAIKRFNFAGNMSIGITIGYSSDRYGYHFENGASPKSLDYRTDTTYSYDSCQASVYAHVPYMTFQGIDYLFKQHGPTLYFDRIPARKETTKPYRFVVKNWVWVTPSRVNQINGLNIGLTTNKFNERPMIINGVNLNADAPIAMLTFYALPYLGYGNGLAHLSDTVNKSLMNSRVSGFSLSAGGLAGDMQVKGISINGGICGITESKGLVITGTQNMTEEFSGVVITGLRNVAIKGKGLQIGLLNVCKHLNGVQIGLWNVNSKRRLPFINWNF